MALNDPTLNPNALTPASAPGAPLLDQRDYRDILQDALARIPVHNPTWTNFNDSDPGVTLIQLFAFMTESIIYRANQVPERNRRKFLELLGIRPRAAAAAKGFVTIANERGPLAPQALAKGLEVRAGQTPFRTTQAITVLPLEAQFFYKRALPTEAEVSGQRQKEEVRQRAELYDLLYADLLEGRNSRARLYETVPLPQPDSSETLPIIDLADTVDGCLWIALLARRGETPEDARNGLGGDPSINHLTIGIMPKIEQDVVVLAGAEDSQRPHPIVHWEIAESTTHTPLYVPLTMGKTTGNEGVPLATPALVHLQLPPREKLRTWDFDDMEPGLEGTGEYPPSLADTNLTSRIITWVRMRVERNSVPARLGWIGINATLVEQRVLVTGEFVGRGTGEPDQAYTLSNRPILPESISVTVAGVPWQQIDDIMSADAEIAISDPRLPIFRQEASIASGKSLRPQRFALEPATGLLTFGDGAHGERPRQGDPIVANYAYGGGKEGNVGAGAINRSPDLGAGFRVTNPIRTWGGDDAESLASAEKSIPRAIQHRDRLVTVADFQEIAKRTPGVEMGRVEVLPLYEPIQKRTDAAGVVTLLVIPDGAVHESPLPDQFFLDSVCAYLQPRRLITTNMHVRGPEYIDVWVSANIEILGGYGAGPVCEMVRQAITRFLSPLYGGYGGAGWPLNTPLSGNELEAVAARVPGVRQVNELRVEATPPLSINFTGLQLPRLAGIAVTEDALIPIDALRAAPPVANLQPGEEWVPIPVIAERC